MILHVKVHFVGLAPLLYCQVGVSNSLELGQLQPSLLSLAEALEILAAMQTVPTVQWKLAM